MENNEAEYIFCHTSCWKKSKTLWKSKEVTRFIYRNLSPNSASGCRCPWIKNSFEQELHNTHPRKEFGSQYTVSLSLASSPDRIHMTYVEYTDKGWSAFTPHQTKYFHFKTHNSNETLYTNCIAARLNLYSKTALCSVKICLHFSNWTSSAHQTGGLHFCQKRLIYPVLGGSVCQFFECLNPISFVKL